MQDKILTNKRPRDESLGIPLRKRWLRNFKHFMVSYTLKHLDPRFLFHQSTFPTGITCGSLKTFFVPSYTAKRTVILWSSHNFLSRNLCPALTGGGRCSGLMVSVLDCGMSSSPGRGHCVAFLCKALNSHFGFLHPSLLASARYISRCS